MTGLFSKDDREKEFGEFLNALSEFEKEKNKPKAKVEYDIVAKSDSIENIHDVVEKLIDQHEGKQELSIKVQFFC